MVNYLLTYLTFSIALFFYLGYESNSTATISSEVEISGLSNH